MRKLFLTLESPSDGKELKLSIKLREHPLNDRLLLCLSMSSDEKAYVYSNESLKIGDRVSPYVTTPYSYISIKSESSLSLDNDIYDLTEQNETFGDVFLAFAYFEDNHPFETFLKNKPFENELPTHVSLHLGISWAPEYKKENKPIDWLWWFNDIAVLKRKFGNYLRRSEGDLNSDAYKFGRIVIGNIKKNNFGSKSYNEIYKSLEKYTIIKELRVEDVQVNEGDEGLESA